MFGDVKKGCTFAAPFETKTSRKLKAITGSSLKHV